MTRPYTMMHRQGRRQQLWDAATRLGKFTYEELHDATGFKPDTIRPIVNVWLGTDRVRRIDAREKKARFEVISSDEPALVAPPTPHGNLWQAMRGLKLFSPVDLAAHANTPEVEVTVAAAQQFCRMLLRAGYLRIERKATAEREAIYRLLRNTGPKPPRERRVWALYDENLGHFSAIAADVSKVSS